MQTSYLFGEHKVPSFTLLDIAKKKSKSSAVQYNLHLSSSVENKQTNKQNDKEVLDLWHSLKMNNQHKTPSTLLFLLASYMTFGSYKD